MPTPNPELDLNSVTGFQWDTGNLSKNKDKHSVDYRECEEAFFNQPLIIHPDIPHSVRENRFYALGKTNQGRKLFIVFTVRDTLLRVISARDQHKKERSIYEAA